MDAKWTLCFALSCAAWSTSSWALGYNLDARYGAYATGGVQQQSDRNISLKNTTDIPGLGSDVPVTTAGGVSESVLNKDKIQSFGLVFSTPLGIGIGVTQTTDTTKKAWNTKSTLATAIDANGTAIKQWAPAGTQLITEDMKSKVDYIDISYSLRTLVGLTIGAGLPVSGSSTVGVKYGSEASALVASATGTVPADESLKVKAKTGYAYFADLAFGLGPVEFLVGYRHEYNKGSVDLTNSPLRLLAGANSIESISSISMVNAGLGVKF